MHIAYDGRKNTANIAKHGLSFEAVYDFDFATSHTVIDARRDYGEVRYRAVGFLHGRLHMLVYTETSDGIRVISFRKANDRERKQYEKEIL